MTKTPQQRHIHRKLKLFWKAPENTPHKALEVLIYVSNIHYKMGPFTHIIQIYQIYNPFEWPYKQVTILTMNISPQKVECLGPYF